MCIAKQRNTLSIRREHDSRLQTSEEPFCLDAGGLCGLRSPSHDVLLLHPHFIHSQVIPEGTWAGGSQCLSPGWIGAWGGGSSEQKSTATRRFLSKSQNISLPGSARLQERHLSRLLNSRNESAKVWWILQHRVRLIANRC